MRTLRNIVVFLLLSICLLVPGCNSTKGRLEGLVSVGPLTPVERIGVPTSTPPPEVFTSRGIKILNSLGILVTEIHFAANGTYSVELIPGKYRVELLGNGIEHAKELPATIEIFSNETTILNISIDTGIR